MSRGRRFAILAVAGALVAAAALVGAYSAARARAGRSFDRLLDGVDRRLAGGYAAKAAEELRAAAAAARSERQWLRLLKRAVALARQGGDGGPLLELAARASRAVPGSRSLQRLHAYAGLRGGGAGTGRLPDDLDGQYLRAESWLRSGTRPPAGLKLDPGLRELLDEEKRRDPEHLGLLAARWNQRGLLLDAGLLLLEAGEPQRAWQLLRGLPAEGGLLELKVLAAYDAGADPEALQLLEPLAAGELGEELQLLRADLLRLQHRDAEAAEAYQRLIAASPRFYWSPYLNLARIAGGRGEAEAAAALHRRAHELFADSEQPAIAFAVHLLDSGQTETALEVLDAVLARHPASVEARWLLLDLGQYGTPQRRQARLRGLLDEDPLNAGLCRVLALSQLALGDSRGAEDTLARYGGEEPEDEGWWSELKGIAAALRGDLPEAEEWLKRSLRSRPDGRVHCNLAAVLAASGRPDSAVRELLLAAERLAGDPRGESQARVRLAELFFRAGNPQAARRESTYALELDPGNGRALLILRMLEGE